MTVEPDSRAPETWLFIDGASSFGGHEVMLLRWIEELLATGLVTPRLVARAGSRLAGTAPPAVLTEPLAAQAPVAGGWRERLARPWRDLRLLVRIARREQPRQCVFASGSLGDQVLLAIASRLLGRRVVVYVPLLDTFREMGYGKASLKDAFVRHVYARFPSAWVAISENQAEHFRRWARPRGPVHVLPNTVARQLEADRPVTLRSIAQDDRIRVLVLGRMDAAQKGLDMLMAHLLRETPERLAGLHIGIVGEGPYRTTLESDRARHPRLAQCVALESWRPAAEVIREYDLLFMPSRFEGVPLVMLEAMALGLPVVASDLPGTRAYVPPECLFAVGDLARALDIVLRLRSLEVRQSLARQGRKTYEREASSEAFARGTAGLARAISGRDRPVRAVRGVNVTGA